MGLADEVRAVRDRALAELRATHDYYDDTRRMWVFVRREIGAGQPFGYTNPTTGTVTTQSELIARIPKYSNKRIAEATFGEFVSIFERFPLGV